MEKIISKNKDPKEYDDEEFEFEKRTDEIISEVIGELLDKIWHERHLVLKYKVENGLETVNPEIWEGALKSAERVREK